MAERFFYRFVSDVYCWAFVVDGFFMTKFPLIEELGLKVLAKENGTMLTSFPAQVGYDYFVLASDLERLLSQAPVVYGKWRPDGEHGWVTEEWSEKTDTHTARLIGVKEIKKDSAEDLLRDLLEKFEAGHGFDMSPYMNRAKKLLEGME